MKKLFIIFIAIFLSLSSTQTFAAGGGDTDGDGLTDIFEEEELNTDPLSPDTDGDCITDTVEYVKGLDPTEDDSDGDGLLDGEEDHDCDGNVDDGETDPLEVDTDLDGLDDFLEVECFGTNPLVEDTDGDGMTDFEEVDVSLEGLQQGECPLPLLNQGGSDPSGGGSGGAAFDSGCAIVDGSTWCFNTSSNFTPVNQVDESGGCTCRLYNHGDSKMGTWQLIIALILGFFMLTLRKKSKKSSR